jgi:hypothetical protein
MCFQNMLRFSLNNFYQSNIVTKYFNLEAFQTLQAYYQLTIYPAVEYFSDETLINLTISRTVASSGSPCSVTALQALLTPSKNAHKFN